MNLPAPIAQVSPTVEQETPKPEQFGDAGATDETSAATTDDVPSSTGDGEGEGEGAE